MKNIKKKILVSALCFLPIITSGCDFSININKKENNKEINNISVSKLDNGKDYIYDAYYSKNTKADSYSIDKTYYAKDIVVPFINIDSNYASKANGEIKSVFDEAISTYNEGVSNKIVYVDECNYKKYINNNYASIILTYAVGGTDLPIVHYYTYNINLSDGQELSYEDIYKLAGFSSSNIESKVKDAITNTMKKELSDFTAENYPSGTNFDIYNDQSIDNYNKSVKNNSLKYFISENGELNIVVTLSIPAGRGSYDTIITVEK